jgi:phosphoglycerate kinase
MTKKSLRDIEVAGKRVIHHCDFNIKLKRNEAGRLVPISDVRLKANFPSIFYLLEKGCRIVFISWLERPGGKIVEDLRMEPIARRLSELINREVKYVPELVGPKVRGLIKQMKPGEMVMLENTRFYPGEEADDDRFAQELARNGQVMVQDAFGHCHRVHASVTGIPRHIPSVAGFYLEEEIKVLDGLMQQPKRPLVLIIGGTKTYDKIMAVKNLIKKADYILLGGAVATVFLKAKGVEVAGSFLEERSVHKAKGLVIDPEAAARDLMKQYPDKIVLPDDLLAGEKIVNPTKKRLIDLTKKQKLPKGWAFLDIGPRTSGRYLKLIQEAKTIFWDGPLGKYETTQFSQGSLKTAEAVAEPGKTSILAGGDTAALAEKFGLLFKYSHVSIAGGASLEYLAGKKLPGIEALLDK